MNILKKLLKYFLEKNKKKRLQKDFIINIEELKKYKDILSKRDLIAENFLEINKIIVSLIKENIRLQKELELFCAYRISSEINLKKYIEDTKKLKDKDLIKKLLIIQLELKELVDIIIKNSIKRED